MDVEKVIQFIADMLDGEIVYCDDGWTIDIWLSADDQAPGKSKACLMFDEDGDFERVRFH